MTTDAPTPPATCPECSINLKRANLDPHSHALTHWPSPLPDEPIYVEARRRKALLLGLDPTSRGAF